jgi:hypothetical protein
MWEKFEYESEVLEHIYELINYHKEPFDKKHMMLNLNMMFDNCLISKELYEIVKETINCKFL